MLMSRIGKLPIALPAGVAIEHTDQSIRVKGPKGSLEQVLPVGILANVEKGVLTITRGSEDREVRAKHGLIRALAANMVKGVTEGFERKLVIQGVGFKAEIKQRNLLLTVGFSHPVVSAMPVGIDITIDKTGMIIVQGIDKQKVGQVAAEIREIREPDSYKGKGLRYLGETVRIKAGKSATK